MEIICHLMDVVNNKVAPPPCDQTLGIHVHYAQDGVAKATWNVTDAFLNANGVVMGGFLSAVADTVMAYAVASCLEKNVNFTSIDLHVTFFRPAQKGTIDIEARVKKLGRKIAYLNVDIFQNGKEVGTAVSSFFIQHGKNL